jgi:hypothetical protein
MIKRRERGIEPRVVIKNCSRAVNIEWRPKLVGYARKIDIFAVKCVVAVMETVHP